jgi:hypothetical protein
VGGFDADAAEGCGLVEPGRPAHRRFDAPAWAWLQPLLPDGATVTVLLVEDDHGSLDESTERELEARIVEADRGDSFVDASEVLRQFDAGASRRTAQLLVLLSRTRE